MAAAQNNRIWSGVIGRHGMGRVNTNGMRQLTFALNITLPSSSRRQNIRPCLMPSRSKHWHIIDFIIVRCNDIKDVLIIVPWEVQSADRSSYDCGQTPNECAPPHLRLWNSNKKLKCNRLGNTEARNEFWHLIDEKLGEPNLVWAQKTTWNNSGPISALCSTDLIPQSLAIKQKPPRLVWW